MIGRVFFYLSTDCFIALYTYSIDLSNICVLVYVEIAVSEYKNTHSEGWLAPHLIKLIHK